MASIDFFSLPQRKEIREAIENAERITSGEIRLFIEDTCGDHVLDRAAFVFKEMGMINTAQRNGVLIYLAVKSRKFAIIGDAGIHAKVAEGFWDKIRGEMQEHFVRGNFIEGILVGIKHTGEVLEKFFPLGEEDKNELSDDIVFGED